jgi:hypothetical protein
LTASDVPHRLSRILGEIALLGFEMRSGVENELRHPAYMLKLVVHGGDKRETDLDELRDSWTKQGISFSFAKLISDYDINQDNPILVKLPG